MTAALRLYYRRVYTTGVEAVPRKGPVLLLANHHASLMDAAILGVLLKRPIHYFTRGDFFNNKFIAWLLKAMNMIPVFNHAGKESINDNEDSFRKAKAILNDGGIILFFPEGSSHVDRNLKSLKKGAFRLALQTSAEADIKQDMLMIPVGISYAHPQWHNTDVLCHFSTPLLVNDYLGLYRNNPSAAILQMKNDSHAGLLKNVLNIEKENRLLIADCCLNISRNDYTFYTTHWLQATRRRFEEEKKICEEINAIDETAAATLFSLTTGYLNSLKTIKINDATLSGEGRKYHYKTTLLITTLPVFAISYLLNALPILTAKKIADRIVKRPDFYAWIWLTTSAVLYCTYIIFLFMGFMIIGWKYAITVILITLVPGPFVIYYLNTCKAYLQESNFRRLQKANPVLINQLKETRTQIKQLMGGSGG